MPSAPIRIVDLLSEGLTFYKKNSVFHGILLWLFIVPLTAANTVWPWFSSMDPVTGMALRIAVSIVLTFLSYWGVASVLLVARRMIQNKAGRSRSSLRSVATESSALVMPLLLTAILRGCFLFYRALLFLVPAVLVLLTPSLCSQDPLPSGALSTLVEESGRRAGSCTSLLLFLPLLIPTFIYLIRTSFYAIAVIVEEMHFRDALRQSISLIRGSFWEVTRLLLLLCCLLLLPATILSFALQTILDDVHIVGLQIVGSALSALLTQGAFLLFLLCLVALYGKLRARAAARTAKD